jgi:hypothetical protein
MDMQDGSTINQKDVEVSYLLNSVFNPEDLNSIRTTGNVFMWLGLGQSSATTDAGGATMISDFLQMGSNEPFTLFDRNDTTFPWIAPVIGMLGTIPYGLNQFQSWPPDTTTTYIESFTGPGVDTTTYMRTALKGFAFGVYDDGYYGGMSPPQPIAGGFSHDTSGYYYDYWYPSKVPLSERWIYDWWYDSWTPAPYNSLYNNGILTLGGMKANGLTRYFNDFDFGIAREGTAMRALVDGGSVTGSAPTSNPNLATIDFFPISTWNSSYSATANGFGYKEGYALISIARDVNGTRGLVINGWDGRDTFWAAAWASQYLSQWGTHPWMPAGTVSLVLKITYQGPNLEPQHFTVVKALGTITEFGANMFADQVPPFGYDNTLYVWNGHVVPPALPGGEWWYQKLPTSSTAMVEFDS